MFMQALAIQRGLVELMDARGQNPTWALLHNVCAMACSEYLAHRLEDCQLYRVFKRRTSFHFF